MSLPLLMVRSGQLLRPADDLAAEDMLSLKEGKFVLVTATHPRSLPHHRLFFAMIRKIARATPTPLDEDALRDYITVKAGHVKTIPLAFGKTYQAPASIAWDKMDQADFRKFFDRAVEIILTDICPSLPESFADEFLAMLGDEPSPQSSTPGSRQPEKLAAVVVA